MGHRRGAWRRLPCGGQREPPRCVLGSRSEPRHRRCRRQPWDRPTSAKAKDGQATSMQVARRAKPPRKSVLDITEVLESSLLLEKYCKYMASRRSPFLSLRVTRHVLVLSSCCTIFLGSVIIILCLFSLRRDHGLASRPTVCQVSKFFAAKNCRGLLALLRRQ